MEIVDVSARPMGESLMNFEVKEEIWFGNVSDEDARQAASASLAARTSRLRGICPFPVAAQQLLDATSSLDYRVREVAEVIESDPALATRLLRIVNSALAGLKRPCRSVQSAVTLLGQRNLRQHALSASVLAGFATDEPHSRAILEHSTMVAALCRELASSARIPAEEVYLCGLLHDVGKLMMLQSGEPGYAALLDENMPGDDLRIRETELYGFDHGILGGQILLDWRIPEPIPLVVGWHHDLGRASRSDGLVRSMVHLVHFADHLTRLVGEETDQEFFEHMAESHDAVALGLSAALLQGIWPRLCLVAVAGVAATTTDEELPYDIELNEIPGAARLPVISIRSPARNSIASPMRLSMRAGSTTSLPAMSRQPIRITQAPMSMSERPTMPIRARSTLRSPIAEPKAQTCGLCSEPSFGLSCPRCGIALCSKHEPREGAWCKTCEQSFQTESQGWADRTHAVIGLVSFLIAGSVLAAAVPARAVSDLGGIATVGFLVLFLGFVVVFGWTRWSRRSEFLRR